MSDLNNNLVALGARIKGAAEELRRAAEIAIRLLGEAPRDDEGGWLAHWPAMAALVDRLAEVNFLFAELPGPEIAGSIELAEDRLELIAGAGDEISKTDFE